MFGFGVNVHHPRSAWRCFARAGVKLVRDQAASSHHARLRILGKETAVPALVEGEDLFEIHR
jgi:hypothetical protein